MFTAHEEQTVFSHLLHSSSIDVSVSSPQQQHVPMQSAQTWTASGTPSSLKCQ